MNKSIFSMIFLLVFMLSYCGSEQASKSSNTLKLKKLWQTPAKLTTAESVIYDHKNDVLYVSNINGTPLDKDGNGFIAKVSLQGKIIKQKWVTGGLNAPKGMGIYKGRLYVTDIDRVFVISIKSGRVLKRYKVKKAKFLNDITIDAQGIVYISDMDTATIYRLRKGKLTRWLRSKKIERVNGLFYQNDSLLAGMKGKIVQINPKTKKISNFIDKTGNIDGLEAYGDGYIVSDWAGKIQFVSRDNPHQVLSNTTNQKIQAADIEVIPEKHLLLVPTFFHNRVVAYQISN